MELRRVVRSKSFSYAKTDGALGFLASSSLSSKDDFDMSGLGEVQVILRVDAPSLVIRRSPTSTSGA